MKFRILAVCLLFIVTLASCNSDDSDNDSASESQEAEQVAPLQLTTDLCEDPNNMGVLQNSQSWNLLISSADINQEQLQRMVEAPTEGPFYMFNLIHFREQAEYADGRETDLTGKEANALYAPIDFLTAIGAQIVFATEVGQQIDGSDVNWDEVGIVEYPCPVAFFAMLSDPEFQARAVHKDAGVKTTYVMVTHLAPSPFPAGFEPPEGDFPATDEDPAFELIHVQDFHEIAQYEEGSDEPERTGKEAWELYVANGAAAGESIGSYPTAKLIVQGVFLGDDRTWDEIQVIHMPSQAGFQALLANETRQDGTHHRLAALANNYSIITYPSINDIPGAPSSSSSGGSSEPLPVTADGVGTICTSDADCVGVGASGGTCLTDGGSVGICTIEGCGTGECGSPYLCCHDCSAAAAPSLPFTGSACLPPDVVGQLTAAPVSCTCD